MGCIGKLFGIHFVFIRCFLYICAIFQNNYFYIQYFLDERYYKNNRAA
jgi:hypothetical protein